MVCFLTFFGNIYSDPKNVVFFQSTYIAYMKTYSVIWKCLIACIEKGWESQQLFSYIIQIRLTRWYDTCFILGQHAGLDFNCPCTQSNRPQEDESPYSETFCPPVTFSLLLNTTHFTEEGPWTILALSWPSACYKVSLYNKDVKFFHQTEHLTVWTSPSSSPHKQKWYQIIRNVVFLVVYMFNSYLLQIMFWNCLRTLCSGGRWTTLFLKPGGKMLSGKRQAIADCPVNTSCCKAWHCLSPQIEI